MLKKILLLGLLFCSYKSNLISQTLHFQGDSTPYRLNYGHYIIELFDAIEYKNINLPNFKYRIEHKFVIDMYGNTISNYFIKIPENSNFDGVIDVYKEVRTIFKGAKVVFVPNLNL